MSEADAAVPAAGPPGEHFFDVAVDGARIYAMLHEPVGVPARAIVVSAHGFNGERVDAHRMLCLLYTSRCV